MEAPQAKRPKPITVVVYGGRIWHYRGQWENRGYLTLCGKPATRFTPVWLAEGKDRPICAACRKAFANYGSGVVYRTCGDGPTCNIPTHLEVREG